MIASIAATPSSPPQGGGRRRRPDSHAGFALTGQRVAVETRGGVGRGSGCIEQDRREGPTEWNTAHDAADQHDGGVRVHAEGQRNQQGQRRRAPETGNGAEEQADRRAESQVAQRLKCEEVGQRLCKGICQRMSLNSS